MATLAQKYAWLLETLRRRGPLSLKELDELWKENDALNPYGKGLDRSKLNRWRKGVLEQFSVEIECELFGSYRYYIGNAAEVLNKNNINTFILENLTLSNVLAEYKGLGKRIVTDPNPSGIEYLPKILTAMKDSSVIDVLYENFNNSNFRLTIEPYALREHQKKWFMLGKVPQFEHLMLLPLERIKNVDILIKEHYKIPPKFDADEFFAQYYGVVINSNNRAQRIVIRAYGSQGNALRVSPLHSSQEEHRLETEGYSDFSYYLVPTYDFTERIVSMGASVEVISPEEYRHEVKEFIYKAVKRYEGKIPTKELKRNKPLNGTFAVIDIEIANEHASSICELAVIVLKNGQIVKKFHSLVKPLPEHFTGENIEYTGLSEKETHDAPNFPEVWDKIKDDISGLSLVAYNVGFEKYTLEATFHAYEMDFPKFEWVDALLPARNLFSKTLPTLRIQTVSGALGYPGKGMGNALDMAEQMAAVALQLL